MKILHVVNRLYPGGAQTMLLSLLKIEKALGFDPRVLTIKDQNMLSEQITAMGVIEDTLSVSRLCPSARKLVSVPAELKNWSPDVVQAWMYHSDVATIYLKYVARIKAPVIWSIHHSIHSLETEKSGTRLVIKMLKWFDWIPFRTVFVSRNSASQHMQIGYNRERAVTIPNGFDTERFKPDSNARTEFRRIHGLSEHCRLVGIFGRFHPVKDFPNFLDAAAILRNRSDAHDIRFILCGRGQDEQNAELLQLVAERGLTDSVIFLGQRDDVEKIYASVDVMVNSSKSEAFPMTVGEAMSCGIPCVVTDVGDCAWLVASGGVVVPPGSSKELADGIDKILLLTDVEHEAMGTIARQRVVDEFSLEAVAGMYHSLYEQAITGARE